MLKQLRRRSVLALGILIGLAAAIMVRKATKGARELSALNSELELDSPEPSGRLWGLLPTPRLLSNQFHRRVELLCDDVFLKVDHDKSGRLDSAELHLAVIILYGRVNGLMRVSLEPPEAEEVKAMLAEADDNHDGRLSRAEFKKVFMRSFFHRIIALASARLLTQRLLVPASAVALHSFAESGGLEAAVAGMAARVSGALTNGLALLLAFRPTARALGARAPRERHAVEKWVAATALHAAPFAALWLTGASARFFSVEPLIARILGSRPPRQGAGGDRRRGSRP
mmetsp:Transcript_19435/g.58576  ORF Transcript_19435/g.58576 Transcript_19435/m.58576 type:complete len:285 (-) Transcript_19435:54-908(-)